MRLWDVKGELNGVRGSRGILEDPRCVSEVSGDFKRSHGVLEVSQKDQKSSRRFPEGARGSQENFMGTDGKSGVSGSPKGISESLRVGSVGIRGYQWS